MSTQRSHIGSLIGGAVLIGIGLMSLAGEFFGGAGFWNLLWPFFVIGFGLLFFVAMFAVGRSAAGLAIPGTIITAIGAMLFLQNAFNHWESWSYGWTVILMAVGLGIFIMGSYDPNPGQRQSGIGLMRVGAILFLIFGGFFEMLFNSFSFSKFLFPAILILVGLYLVVRRTGLLPGRTESSEPVPPPDQPLS